MAKISFDAFTPGSSRLIGRQVRIKAGMKEFIGKTGRISDKEGNMYRVELDEPVDVPGVGRVEDDLWELPYLTLLSGDSAADVEDPRAKALRQQIADVKYRAEAIRNKTPPFQYAKASEADRLDQTVVRLQEQLKALG